MIEQIYQNRDVEDWLEGEGRLEKEVDQAREGAREGLQHGLKGDIPQWIN